MAFERKRKRNREIDRRRGRRRVAFFRVSRVSFFSGSFWHGNQITWRQLRRIEECFFFSFDTIETGSEKGKKKKLNAIGERECVCMVVSGFQLTRYRAKRQQKENDTRKNFKGGFEDDDDDE